MFENLKKKITAAFTVAKLPHTSCTSIIKYALKQENFMIKSIKKTNKLHGLSPQANYADQATATCRRSDCQLLRIEGATWSA
jgi:hypothetical protein